jgi:ADP-heptose:LPS heptosyltransferase
VLLARPAMRAMRSRFLDHHIALMAGEEVGGLLLEAKEVDRLFALECGDLGTLLGGQVSLRQEFATWLSTCQRAVGWLRDEEGEIKATLRRHGIGSILMRSPSNDDILGIHQASRFIEAIGEDGTREPTVQRLPVPVVRRKEGAAHLRRLGLRHEPGLVAVHSGSGSRHKCLNPVVTAHVVDSLAGDGYTPFLVSGPADLTLTAEVVAHSRSRVAVLTGVDLPTMTGILSHVRLFVGHDSGLTHLAAALAVPLVACFGPTDPRRWKPLGSAAVVLTGEPCLCDNWTAVRECQEKRCLRILPERIIRASRELLILHQVG